MVGQHLGGLTVQAAALPIRQNEKYRQSRNQRADQRIKQPRPDQVEAIPHLIETAQHQQGDRGRGDHVMLFTIGKERYARRHGNHALDKWLGEQADRRPACNQPKHRAQNPLGEKAPGGGEVRAAHKQRGEQNPKALLWVEPLQQPVTHHQRGG